MTLTAAGDILESVTLVNLDVPPVLVSTSGEGAPAQLFSNEDIIFPTSSNVQYSTYTLGPRIPTNAKIKKVESYCKGVDSNATAAGAFDINLIFSDAPLGGIAAGMPVNDGTTLTNAGQIPTSALTGAITSITAYASPNKMFGSSKVLMANSGAYLVTDLTYANTFTPAMSQLPLWDVLGFTIDPGGYFNFFLVMAVASSTAAAGTIMMKVSYAV
jgi:hypothetical protein